MSIKENLTEIKRAASSQEQFLESIIKSEYFVRKYKKPLILIVVLVVVLVVAYLGNDYLKNAKFERANAAFSELILDPENEKAKEKLKSNSKNLYAIYEFRNALDKNDTAKLEELSNLSGIDPILVEILKTESGKDSEFLRSYEAFLKGYSLLKDGKFKEAEAEFVKIPTTSSMHGLVKNLRHYGSEK